MAAAAAVGVVVRPRVDKKMGLWSQVALEPLQHQVKTQNCTLPMTAVLLFASTLPKTTSKTNYWYMIPREVVRGKHEAIARGLWQCLPRRVRACKC